METRTTEMSYVTVTNRNNGTTGYTLQNGVRRQFQIGQSRKVDLEELRELAAIPGGEYILQNYLIINDKTALDYLNIAPEPEYFYTEKEIKELLLNGTLDQFEDCLNFAPQGVIDLVKSMAIDLKLPDVRKRELIFEKTGFNVTNALNVNAVLDAESEKPVDKPKVERKAQPITAVTEPTRKAAPPKYNVVSITKK